MPTQVGTGCPFRAWDWQRRGFHPVVRFRYRPRVNGRAAYRSITRTHRVHRDRLPLVGDGDWLGRIAGRNRPRWAPGATGDRSPCVPPRHRWACRTAAGGRRWPPVPSGQSPPGRTDHPPDRSPISRSGVRLAARKHGDRGAPGPPRTRGFPGNSRGVQPAAGPVNGRGSNGQSLPSRRESV